MLDYNEILNGKDVILASDWHMYKYDKTTGLVNKRADYDKIIERQNDAMNSNSVFLFLGDLVDDNITDRNIVSDLIKSIKGPKILIRGNNDIFEDEFYINNGFMSVEYAIRYNNVIFSHTSIPIDGSVFYNIHGHIHRDGWDANDIPYYHPCKQNINVCGMKVGMPVLKYMPLERLATINTKYIEGQTEKAGMTRFIQNMAYQVYLKAEKKRIFK